MNRISKMLTFVDVAEQCSVSVKTVRRWIGAGELVAHRLGWQLRIADRDLAAFLAVRRQADWPGSDAQS